MAKSTLSSSSFIVNAVKAEVNNKRVFCLGQLESCRVISCTRAARCKLLSSLGCQRDIRVFGGIPYFAQNLKQSYVEHGRHRHDSRRARACLQIEDRERQTEKERRERERDGERGSKWDSAWANMFTTLLCLLAGPSASSWSPSSRSPATSPSHGWRYIARRMRCCSNWTCMWMQA